MSLILYLNALFVSTLLFSGKWFIFRKVFSKKLSHFSVFGNDLENELKNVFWCLICKFSYLYFLYNLNHVHTHTHIYIYILTGEYIFNKYK